MTAATNGPQPRDLGAESEHGQRVQSPDRQCGDLVGAGPVNGELVQRRQLGGSLFGLQESNPVDTEAAYGGNSAHNGEPNDPLVGTKIGGINVFGGGLALYNAAGELVGGVGVSGNTSCTDHVVAWKVRHLLNLDSVPTGVAPGATDNMIQDVADVGGHPVSAGGFGHPTCLNNPSPALLQNACPRARQQRCPAARAPTSARAERGAARWRS